MYDYETYVFFFYTYKKSYINGKIPQLSILACIVHLAARQYEILIVNNGGCLA